MVSCGAPACANGAFNSSNKITLSTIIIMLL